MLQLQIFINVLAVVATAVTAVAMAWHLLLKGVAAFAEAVAMTVTAVALGHAGCCDTDRLRPQ